MPIHKFQAQQPKQTFNLFHLQTVSKATVPISDFRHFQLPHNQPDQPKSVSPKVLDLKIRINYWRISFKKKSQIIAQILSKNKLMFEYLQMGQVTLLTFLYDFFPQGI